MAAAGARVELLRTALRAPPPPRPAPPLPRPPPLPRHLRFLARRHRNILRCFRTPTTPGSPSPPSTSPILCGPRPPAPRPLLARPRPPSLPRLPSLDLRRFFSTGRGHPRPDRPWLAFPSLDTSTTSPWAVTSRAPTAPGSPFAPTRATRTAITLLSAATGRSPWSPSPDVFPQLRGWRRRIAVAASLAAGFFLNLKTIPLAHVVDCSPAVS